MTKTGRRPVGGGRRPRRRKRPIVRVPGQFGLKSKYPHLPPPTSSSSVFCFTACDLSFVATIWHNLGIVVVLVAVVADDDWYAGTFRKLLGRRRWSTWRDCSTLLTSPICDRNSSSVTRNWTSPTAYNHILCNSQILMLYVLQGSTRYHNAHNHPETGVQIHNHCIVKTV